MATCENNCLHYNVCNYHIDEETPFAVTECNNFKNKADFVEVVRCKECKEFIEKGEEILLNKRFGICEKSRTGFFDNGEEVYEDDFCSYGKRRDTE